MTLKKLLHYNIAEQMREYHTNMFMWLQFRKRRLGEENEISDRTYNEIQEYYKGKAEENYHEASLWHKRLAMNLQKQLDTL